MFDFYPFSDTEWAAREGRPGVTGKKGRSVLGTGAFATTYRVVGRAGVQQSGVNAGQVLNPSNSFLP